MPETLVASTPFSYRRISLTLVPRMRPRNEGQANMLDCRGLDYCDRLLSRVNNNLPCTNLWKRLIVYLVLHGCGSRRGLTPVEDRAKQPVAQRAREGEFRTGQIVALVYALILSAAPKESESRLRNEP